MFIVMYIKYVDSYISLCLLSRFTMEIYNYVVMFLQFAEAVNTEACMDMRTQHVAKYRRYVRKHLMDKCKTDKEICEGFCSRPCSNKQMGECRECVNAINRVCASPLGRLECHKIGEGLICPFLSPEVIGQLYFQS